VTCQGKLNLAIKKKKKEFLFRSLQEFCTQPIFIRKTTSQKTKATKVKMIER